MRLSMVRTIGLVSAFTLVGCEGVTAPPATLRVDVAALSLEGVTDATYTLTVTGPTGVVWTEQVTSGEYGDGGGSVSYVGTCDAGDGAADNTVSLVVDGLSTASGPLTAGVDFANPAPAAQPLTRTFTCRANTDVAVDFDLTISRRATQGFFDVAVTLSSLFCSAKLDCVAPDGPDADSDPDPLFLLHDGTGSRGRSLVLALACTGGPGADTHLYMDDLELDCGAAGSATLSPSGPAGNKGAVAPLLFEHAVYFGSEPLGGYHKVYWNVALGVDESALSATAPCALSTTATASPEAFTDGVAPPATTWPAIHWDVTLNALGSDTLTCGNHAVGEAGSGVDVVYAQGDAFTWQLDGDWGGGGLGHAPTLGEAAPAPATPPATLFPYDSLFVTLGGTAGTKTIYRVAIIRDADGVPIGGETPIPFASVPQSGNPDLELAGGGTGALYVAADGAIRIYQPDGSYSTFATGLSTGLHGLAGIAVAPTGEVYVAEYGDGRVLRIPATGGAAPFTEVLGASQGVTGPIGLTIDPINGDLWLASYSDNKVLRRTSAGVVTTVTTSANRPADVAILCDGRVFVSEHYGAGVDALDVSTGVVTEIVDGINNPEGMALDDRGWMYTAINGGSVYRFNAEGNLAELVEVVASDIDGLAWVGAPCP